MMMTTRPEEPRPGQPYFGGDLVMVKPPNVEAGGHLSAYDPISGEIRWRHKTKYPMFASQLATAGDLVFTGDYRRPFYCPRCRHRRDFVVLSDRLGTSRIFDDVFGERQTVRCHAQRLGVGGGGRCWGVVAGGKGLSARFYVVCVRPAGRGVNSAGRSLCGARSRPGEPSFSKPLNSVAQAILLVSVGNPAVQENHATEGPVI